MHFGTYLVMQKPFALQIVAVAIMWPFSPCLSALSHVAFLVGNEKTEKQTMEMKVI